MMTTAFLQRILEELQRSVENDPLLRCGPEALSQIITTPDIPLKLANEKLHVFPFKDVDICWRRLYTDAGISRAIRLIRNDTGSEDWLNQTIKQLDMVLIMTGAPLREEMVERILSRLQDDAGFCGKDWSDTFDKTTLRIPGLLFPVEQSVLTLSQFRKILQASQPHVIKEAINYWPALTTRPWSSPSYLRYCTIGGRRLVPVELGRSYTDDDWGQAIIPFAEFLDKFILKPGSSMAYLAQHDLLAQIPALREDIVIPDFCYTDPPCADLCLSHPSYPATKLDEPLLNAWFGPAGTISPLHTDPYHNILCQIVGKKYVRIYNPNQRTKLYPRGTENGIDMSNTSRVPPELVEMSLGPDDEFPLFDEAQYVETILSEGDSLYIPAGWWHYVRSLSISFSVSFWWN